MHEDQIYTIDTTSLDDLTFDTVTIPTLSNTTSTITLSMPDENVFIKTPDYDSKKVKQELGIDMIQELKTSFGE